MTDGVVTWVEASGKPPIYWAYVGFAVLCALFLPALTIMTDGPRVLIDLLALSPPSILSAVLYTMMIVFPTECILLILYVIPTRIGVDEAGVRVARGFGEFRVPWEDLRPSRARPGREWAIISRRAYRSPSRRAGARIIWVSRAQAQAILGYPRAPVALFPPEFLEWVGRSKAAVRGPPYA